MQPGETNVTYLSHFLLSPGDEGFVDIFCKPCCYYESESRFQAPARSELSRIEEVEKNKWEKLKDLE